MTPFQKLAQVFNRNSKTYHSVKIEDDDERLHQEKEPALTVQGDAEKDLYSRDIPADDDLVDDDDDDDDKDYYGDLKDEGKSNGNPQRCSSYLGIAMSVAAGFFMACSSLMVKLAKSLSFCELVAMRGIGLISFSLPILIYFLQPIIPTTKRETGLVYGQAILACGIVFGLYFAFEHISLADATTIFFINPVWTAILAYFFLREKWSKYDSFALVLSVAGVVLVTRPSFLFLTQQSVSSTNDTGKILSYAVSFAGSVGNALCYILVRKSNTATPALTFVFHYGIVCTVFGLLGGIASQGLKFPDCGSRDNWYALLVAVFSFAGQASLIYALTIEQAAFVALGRSTDIAFVFLLEVVFLNVPINGYSLVGSALVFLCNTILVMKKLYTENS